MNNEPTAPINMTASIDRRIADLRATPAPIMPTAPIRRPAPRRRRNSVPHRAIR